METLILFVVLWLIPSVYTYSASYAYWSRKFPLLHKASLASGDSERLFPLIWSSFGIISFLAWCAFTMMCQGIVPNKYGFKF